MLEKVPQLPVDRIDDLIVGCAIPERKQGFNMARLVAARAGLPDSVCGMTINRFCSSGLQAIALAAGQIACGVAGVAGGVSNRCPVNLDISDTFDALAHVAVPALFQFGHLTVSGRETARAAASTSFVGGVRAAVADVLPDVPENRWGFCST